jgi:hypothetical protein
MKWRWLAVVGASFMLSACETFPVCSSPGAVAGTTCYHYLTITKLNRESGEAMGSVAQSVVEADQKRYIFFKDYDVKDYNFFGYSFQVQNSDLANLKTGANYMFVSEPHQSLLKLCTTDECNRAKLELDEPNKH